MKPSAAEPGIAWGEWLPAPAKINLFLHVVGRRADGYHELQTVFRFVGLFDRLRFHPRADARIELATALDGVAVDDNLVVRAARAVQRASGTQRGVTIELAKTIPMGGGLGGGSSDAATTLLALDALWDAHLGRERLLQAGVALGADVPVFIGGENAFAEGIGDRLTPITLPPAWYVILVPPVSVPTGSVFTDPALTRDTERTTMAAFFAGQHLANDLEPVVRRRHPEVGRAIDWLAGRGKGHGGAGSASSAVPSAVRMSGSGSCVFAEYASEASAREVLAHALAALPEMQGFAVPGLDRHPLAGRHAATRTLGSRQVG